MIRALPNCHDTELFYPIICRRMDYDKDGKLSFVEFCDHTYDTYKNYVEYESAGLRTPKSEEVFAELDLDKDRYKHYI